MMIRWIGAGLVVTGCGATGFLMAAGSRRESRMLRQLLRLMAYMEAALAQELLPLAELCRQAARLCGGTLRNVFEDMARELDWQSAPDAYSCMVAAIRKSPELSRGSRRVLLQLGRSLGRFDLQGQLSELQAARVRAELELRKMEQDEPLRLRSYRTLGLCTGAALAVLFL